MKIVQLLGRGVAGCGETKFSVEFEKFLSRNAYEFDTIAIVDKKWSRDQAHSFQKIKRLKFTKENEFQQAVNACSGADVLVVETLPPDNSPEIVQTRFEELINGFQGKVIMIQHDHSILSMKRNACSDTVVNKAHVIFCHSMTGDFANGLLSSGGLDSFMGGEVQEYNIVNFQPGIYFDEIKAKYWKDIKDTDVRNHRWIGRTTPWKGYYEMGVFHQNYLRKIGASTYMQGFEKSIAYVDMITKLEKDGVEITSYLLPKGPRTGPRNYGGPVDVYGMYVQEEMLEQLSLDGFGYQLSRLKPRFIERSLEYTHCEVAAVGVVPVFRKSYGDSCNHRLHGVPLTRIKDSGTIWLDENDMQPAYELVNKLTNDNVMRDEWRNMAFENYKSHQDADHTFNEIMKHII